MAECGNTCLTRSDKDKEVPYKSPDNTPEDTFIKHHEKGLEHIHDMQVDQVLMVGEIQKTLVSPAIGASVSGIDAAISSGFGKKSPKEAVKRAAKVGAASSVFADKLAEEVRQTIDVRTAEKLKNIKVKREDEEEKEPERR